MIKKVLINKTREKEKNLCQANEDQLELWKKLRMDLKFIGVVGLLRVNKMSNEQKKRINKKTEIKCKENTHCDFHCQIFQ